MAMCVMAVGHRYHHFTAHDLPFQVRIGVVLAGAVVPILVDRCMWRQLFKPHLIIVVQAALVVVDEYAGGYVHRIYKGQAPLYHIPLSYH